MVVYGRAAYLWGMISIKCFRVALVEVYDNRVFLVGVEVGRFRDNSLQRFSV
jgi:hypothetical protein